MLGSSRWLPSIENKQGTNLRCLFRPANRLAGPSGNADPFERRETDRHLDDRPANVAQKRCPCWTCSQEFRASGKQVPDPTKPKASTNTEQRPTCLSLLVDAICLNDEKRTCGNSKNHRQKYSLPLYFKAESKSVQRQTTFFPASMAGRTCWVRSVEPKKPMKTATGQNFAILENEQDLTYRVPRQGET